MKSLTSKFASARGWALFLILFLGAGLFVAACGDEDVPTPTAPAPTPPAPPPAPAPEPEPEPEPPAVPVGLRISASGVDSITWTWNAVEGATGYVVQSNMDEMWDETDTVMFGLVPFTTETTYTRTGLEPGTTVYARVAAAAGTADAPLVSNFSTHVTGMTMAAAPTRPPAPTNVRVTGQTDTTMTWRWNTVEGAAGYQVQHSDDATITDDAPTAFSSTTTYTASNLPSRAARYVRVRAYFGALSEPLFGDWSATAEGTTERPPPPPEPTQLDAPTGVTAGSATRTTIDVSWNDVDEAGSYTVQQSAAGAAFTGASCDGGNSEVTGTSCTAEGLAQGISYQFRVRANADDDDLANSAWSSATPALDTTGRREEPVPSGDDDLGISWESDDTSITWSWDAASDRRIQYQVALLADPRNTPDSTDARPKCPSLAMGPAAGEFGLGDTIRDEWFAKEPTFAKTLSVALGEVFGLCVVGTWDTDTGPQYGDVSLVWAAAPPAIGAVPDGAGRIMAGVVDDDRESKSINWFVALDSGFKYSVKTASATSGSSSSLSCASSDLSGNTVWEGVSAGRRFELTNPKDYTGYIACAKASNGQGESEWEQIGDDTYVTRPGAPQSVRYDSPNSTKTSTSITSEWTFSGSSTLPMDPGDYTAKVLVWVGTTVDAQLSAPNPSGARLPTESECEAGVPLTGFHTALFSPSAIEEVGSGKFSFTAEISILEPEQTYRIYACVQAQVQRDSTTLGGLWARGGSTSVKTDPAPE